MRKKYAILCFYVLLSSFSFGNTIGNHLETSKKGMPPCSIPNPTINNNCTTPLGSVILGNLPSGSWTLLRSLNGGPFIPLTGSGTTYIDTGLLNGSCYQYQVIDSNGCNSSSIYFCVGYLDGLSGTMTGTYVDYNNDGITNLGDIIQYNITITNGTFCSNDVTFSFGNLLSSNGTITNLAAGATDSSGVLNYVLTQDDINSGSVFNWVALNGISSNNCISYAKVFMSNPITLPISDGIKLNAFFDTNNNGIQESGEINVTTGYFNYEVNNNGIAHLIYSSSGTDIIYETTPTNSYNLSFNAQNYCDGQSYLSAATYNNIFVLAGSGITTYNFPVTTSPCQDSQVYLYGMFPRAGSNFTNYILYANYGNQTLTSGTVTYTKDPSLTITTISDSNAVISPTGFTCNFTNLLPNQYRLIEVTLSVPPIPTVNIGDLINNSVSLTIPPLDVNQLNNSDAITCNIVSSYDPNYKLENHGGKILYSTFSSNDYLTYTIQFENTGTSNAINIRVHDILDSKLDETSLKMVAASNPYVLERVNSTLNWKFDGINLLPSVANTSIGHGYIVFQIKPKPGYSVGDIIPNTADIYFDTNPGIFTNTCNTEFVNTLSTDESTFTNFTYYPNPVKNRLFLFNSLLLDEVEITSVLGQKVLFQKVKALQSEIDLTGISNGIYFVKVNCNGQEKTVKILKE